MKYGAANNYIQFYLFQLIRRAKLDLFELVEGYNNYLYYAPQM